MFDLDGVLYEGDQVVTGAADVINWCNTEKIPHLFLTNTSSRPRSALVERLEAFHIKSETSDYLTPPVAASLWLKHRNVKNVSLFIPASTQTEFSDFNLCADETMDTDAVIIGDLGEEWDFKLLNTAFRLLMNNPDATLIALGMTRYWRAADGLRLDAAPFVKALEHATGRTTTVLGKPSTAFYQAALDKLGTQASSTLMIGDDIRGDIEGGQQAGLRTALVRTGKFQQQDLESGVIPDTVLDSVADLPAWWQKHD